MTPRELGTVFPCAGASLVGMLSLPAEPVSDVGVVIAVGGPQYRAGMHRQFTLLARRLASEGWPALRFDFRGMGDSTGEFPGFEAVGPDLEAAAGALRAACPAVRRVVVWGLCDGASAALLHAPRVQGVAGLVLLNPWTRHPDSLLRAQLRHYYGRRALDPAFWKKLAGGGVDVLGAVRDVGGKLAALAALAAKGAWSQGSAGDKGAAVDYRERMAEEALSFAGRQLYILSGRDLVCAEFLDFAAGHPRLPSLWSRPTVRRLDLPAADHTFSASVHRTAVEEATLGWLRELPG